MERLLLDDLKKWKEKGCIRTSLLPYERNEQAQMLNIPLYLLFTLGEEIAD